MIQSKEDLKYYIDCDRKARGFPKNNMRHKLRNLIYMDPTWKFQKLLRRVEYYHNKKKILFSGLDIYSWSIDSRNYPSA